MTTDNNKTDASDLSAASGSLITWTLPNGSTITFTPSRGKSLIRGITTFHKKETCNNCGSLNDVKWIDGAEGTMYEGETKCTCCEFNDYWAHGFFASMQDGYNRCEKYYR